MILRSDAWLNYFQKNTASDFRCKMNEYVKMEGNWEVALCNMVIYKPKNVRFGHGLWVYCDICTSTQIGDNFDHLLRFVSIEDARKQWFTFNFENKYYIPVIKRNVDEININIRTNYNYERKENFINCSSSVVIQKPQSLESKATIVTLHFRKTI